MENPNSGMLKPVHAKGAIHHLPDETTTTATTDNKTDALT
jgi:hypothetical protein